MQLRQRSYRRIERQQLTGALAIALGGLFALGCGGQQKTTEEAVVTETPATEILRIGRSWVSTRPSDGILSPPAAISVFHTTVTSRIALTGDSAEETLTFHEEVSLRSGGEVTCDTTFHHPLAYRFGRRHGDAALEVTRPPLSGQRSCQGSHPEPMLSAPGYRMLMVLNADTLTVTEPKTDRSTYLPAPE